MSFDATLLIVEDELIIAENIRDILNRGGYEHILMAEDVESAVALLDVSAVSIVITDIMLGKGQTGIDLGELIHTTYKLPFLYITSHASAEIVGKAKHTYPSAYITKPFKKEDVLVAVELALFNANVVQEEATELILKNGHSNMRIPYTEIRWMESNGNYVTIHLAGDRQTTVRNSLGNLLEELPEADFVRIHKSYLVNKNYMKPVKASVVAVDQKELPVGRSYQQLVVNLFN